MDGNGEWDYYWIVMDWIIPSFPTFSTRPVIIEKSTSCREVWLMIITYVSYDCILLYLTCLVLWTNNWLINIHKQHAGIQSDFESIWYLGTSENGGIAINWPWWKWLLTMREFSWQSIFRQRLVVLHSSSYGWEHKSGDSGHSWFPPFKSPQDEEHISPIWGLDGDHEQWRGAWPLNNWALSTLTSPPWYW